MAISVRREPTAVGCLGPQSKTVFAKHLSTSSTGGDWREVRGDRRIGLSDGASFTITIVAKAIFTICDSSFFTN